MRAAALLASVLAVMLASAPSARAQPASAEPPSVIVAPTVQGELREGAIVGAVGGRWSGSEPISFDGRWDRCDAARCVPTGERGFLKRVSGSDVGLRLRAVVTASNAAGATQTYTVQSGIVTPASGRFERLKPFPVIGISGTSTPRGARLRGLSVQGPRGSTVQVTCRGRGCPYRSVRRRLGGTPFLAKRIVGRSLAVGTMIAVRVTSVGRIGKYTRFRIRRNRKPARVDRCLVPGRSGPSRCPPASSRMPS